MIFHFLQLALKKKVYVNMFLKNHPFLVIHEYMLLGRQGAEDC